MPTTFEFAPEVQDDGTLRYSIPSPVDQQLLYCHTLRSRQWDFRVDYFNVSIVRLLRSCNFDRRNIDFGDATLRLASRFVSVLNTDPAEKKTYDRVACMVRAFPSPPCGGK